MPERFATIVTCIDGRIQRPLDAWARRHLDVDYLDIITEPGPDSAIAASSADGLSPLLDKIRVSQRAHGSSTLVIAGHSDCAGNPVSDVEHEGQVRAAAARLAEHLPDTRIIAVHTGQCGAGCWRPRLIVEHSVAEGGR